MKFGAILGVSLSLFATQQIGDQGVYTTSDGKQCPLEGTGGSVGSKKLSCLKNRFTFPGANDFDKEVTLAAMLAPGDDTDRFDPLKAARIVGYVVKVKVGGTESCNCKAKNSIDMDAHIQLALSKDAPPRQQVIVEVTPRMRLLMKQKGIDWTTETLQKDPTKKIQGRWVEVTGWLLFDSIHADVAENTNPGNETNWRATCWQIHPVTNLEILNGPPDGTPELRPSTLAAFHKAHAQHVARDPKRKAMVEATIKKHLSDFDEGDLKEKQEEAKDRFKD